MLLKTKLLFSALSTGVVGATGAGIYYGTFKKEDNKKTQIIETEKTSKKPEIQAPAQKIKSPAPVSVSTNLESGEQ